MRRVAAAPTPTAASLGGNAAEAGDGQKRRHEAMMIAAASSNLSSFVRPSPLPARLRYLLGGSMQSFSYPLVNFPRARRGYFFGGRLGLISTRLGRLRSSWRRRSVTTRAMSSGWSCHARSSLTVSPPNSVLTEPGMT